MRSVSCKISRKKWSYWIIRGTSALVLVILLLLTTTCGDESVGEPETGNYPEYGLPEGIPFPWRSDCENCITFGVIADTHVDASSLCDTGSNIHENRGEVYDLNIDCKSAGCAAVVHLGDMINGINVDDVGQQLIAFRQMWENDYPGVNGGTIKRCGSGNESSYNNGYKINFPVFTGLGNHDVGHCKDVFSAGRPSQYMRHRIDGAPGIIDSIGKSNGTDAYAWRLGRYFFIQLGLWAGSDIISCEDYTETDMFKLQWLQDFLKNNVGDSGLGVLIFQHYGWDNWTITYTKPVWWTGDQRLKELNVFCRRDINNTDPDAQCNPYNILGIFTGHVHSPQEFLDVYAGKVGDDNFYFKNFVMRTSGVIDSKERGYSIVKLDGQKMTINSKNRAAATNQWTTYETPIDIPPIHGWSQTIFGPKVGGESAGGGAAIADIDGNKIPDLVLMNIDNPEGPNQFWYVVGWNLDANGNPTSWSPVKFGPSIGGTTSGGGAAITHIDGNETLDLVFMAIDNPDQSNQFWYVVGKDIDKSGNIGSGNWSGVKHGPCVGYESAGGGAAIAKINSNDLPDLVLMAIDNPAGSSQFLHVVGWDLDDNGDPTGK